MGALFASLQQEQSPAILCVHFMFSAQETCSIGRETHIARRADQTVRRITPARGSFTRSCRGEWQLVAESRQSTTLSVDDVHKYPTPGGIETSDLLDQIDL